MGDVNIVIKDGHIVGVDSEGDDDTDIDNYSGSGQNELTTPPDLLPTYTPAINETQGKVTQPDTPVDYLPYILIGLAIVVVLVLIVAIYACIKRRRKARDKKKDMGPVLYNPDNPPGCGAGEGYSVAIPLKLGGDVPSEDAPPPPVPASSPPYLSKPSTSSAASSGANCYTPLGARKDGHEDEKDIYEAIDDEDVANVYEDPLPALPKSNSGRNRILSSVTEDPNMGEETDKMLPVKA